VDRSRTLPADVEHGILDELLAVKALLAAATQVAGDAIVQLDEHRRVVRFSRSAETLLGMSPESVMGSSFDQLVHDGRACDFGAGDAGVETRMLVLRDSAGKPVRVTARSVALRRGSTIDGWMLALAPDRRVEEIEQLKNELVSTVSHELKTPLAAIKAYTATLRANPSLYEAHRNEFLAVVEEQADRLSRLVDDMLLVTRVESGHMLRRRDLVPVDTIVDRAVRDVERDPSLHPIDLRAGGAMISGDPERLCDIFRNLLENAVKYSPKGGTVSISAHSTAQQTVIEIRDRGAGIAEADLPYIFDRFYRAQDEHTKNAGGSGLGLYIVHALVRAHGGTIDVRSELGSGTTFTLRMPLR
jgi:two-component system phosphate regulon sensor histidine kinase PhoR